MTPPITIDPALAAVIEAAREPYVKFAEVAEKDGVNPLPIQELAQQVGYTAGLAFVRNLAVQLSR